MPSKTINYKVEFREGPWVTLPPDRVGGVYHYYVNIFPTQDIAGDVEPYSTLEYLRNEGGVIRVPFGNSVSFVSARLGHFPQVKIYFPGMPQLLKVTVHWTPLRREGQRDQSSQSARDPRDDESGSTLWRMPANTLGQRVSVDLDRILRKPVQTWSEKDVEAVMTERLKRPDIDPLRQQLAEFERQWFRQIG